MFLAVAMRLIIAAFPEGGAIPALHTCEGADLSPAIEWSGAPNEAKSFALIVDDPDAPGGIWNHWLLFNVPAAVHAIAQGFKPGKLGESGANDFGNPGYNGPCPPKGHGPHRYSFRLLALDVAKLDLKPGASRAQLDRAIKGHVIGRAEYMGRYERR
ncbi:MAG TPA: YbhB/YbcL family Raf kinase inhibitor-like protein [Bryobacteraceae bacterium]|nr:YbhB/YbcL family Raf kinase inhibitor-like protein [Bryobacteraceae bacterium]